MTIRVQDVIEDLPHFATFCSVEKLHGMVERLRTDARFRIEVAGTSVNGVPIHHVRFGAGSVKALFIGGPHCMEPIGSLTVFGLMFQLLHDKATLLEADVEWHIVPCLDPDGALLNEGWSQQPFSIDNYIRNFYLQPRPDQVDFSFPIAHKKLVFDRPSKEARVLQKIFDTVRPDFCFSLHNYFGAMGGAWYALSRDIGHIYYRQIRELMQKYGVTLRSKGLAGVAEFDPGMRSLPTIRGYYDFLEQQDVAIPEEYLQGRLGASSLEYLLEIKPSALTFVAELPYGSHPAEASLQETGENLRQLNLRIFADNKYIASLILEEWEKVKTDLDVQSPFYRKIVNELVAIKDCAHEGVTEWYEQSIRYLMFNPADCRPATQRDVVHLCTLRSVFLANAYVFVRLLKSSQQTPAVRRAIELLDGAFDAAIEDLKKRVDPAAYHATDCDRLARVQLGSGLIALNSVLAANQGGSLKKNTNASPRSEQSLRGQEVSSGKPN
jgi:hypothetical protein